jgi:hypothetical protein
MDKSEKEIKTRTLKDGRVVLDLEKAKTLEVYTKCPGKWLLTDLETGQSYIGNYGNGSFWKKTSRKYLTID